MLQELLRLSEGLFPGKKRFVLRVLAVQGTAKRDKPAVESRARTASGAAQAVGNNEFQSAAVPLSV